MHPPLLAELLKDALTSVEVRDTLLRVGAVAKPLTRTAVDDDAVGPTQLLTVAVMSYFSSGSNGEESPIVVVPA